MAGSSEQLDSAESRNVLLGPQVPKREDPGADGSKRLQFFDFPQGAFLSCDA